MIELIAPMPRNRSRTSTHAMSVPVTALMATTISEITMVTSSAATASGLVTARQNPPIPPSIDFAATAASGSSTMTLRYAIASPRPIAAPPRAGANRRGGGRAIASLAGRSRDPQLAFDLRHDARLGIEELLAHDRPAAELLDREETARLRELVRGRDPAHHRPVPLLGEGGLGLGGVQVVDERRRRLRRGLRNGDRVLDQDGLLRDDVVERHLLLLCRDRLVLVRDEDVALAAGERLQRVSRALVLNHDVLQELSEERLGLRGRLALRDLAAVRAHDVPARAARGERVRGDDLHPRLDQVVPAGDALGIALPHR